MTSSGDKERHDSLLKAAGQEASGDFPLFAAALAASALDHGDADMGAYEEHGAELVAKAGPDEQLAPEEIVRRLSETLAMQYGYRGDADDYDAPENADLIRVIDRRKGLPVALGVLYLHVARGCGWPVFGVNLPGHFVLAAGESDTPVIFDPFHQGRTLTPDDVVALAQQAGQEGSEDEPIRLSGMNDRDVLIRLMNNQRMRAAQGGDAQRTSEILRRMVLIAPQSAPLWSDYGAASQAAGNLRAAMAAFGQVGELAPDTDLAANADAALQALRTKLN